MKKFERRLSKIEDRLKPEPKVKIKTKLVDEFPPMTKEIARQILTGELFRVYGSGFDYDKFKEQLVTKYF